MLRGKGGGHELPDGRCEKKREQKVPRKNLTGRISKKKDLGAMRKKVLGMKTSYTQKNVLRGREVANKGDSTLRKGGDEPSV